MTGRQTTAPRPGLDPRNPKAVGEKIGPGDRALHPGGGVSPDAIVDKTAPKPKQRQDLRRQWAEKHPELSDDDTVSPEDFDESGANGMTMPDVYDIPEGSEDGLDDEPQDELEGEPEGELEEAPEADVEEDDEEPAEDPRLTALMERAERAERLNEQLAAGRQAPQQQEAPPPDPFAGLESVDPLADPKAFAEQVAAPLKSEVAEIKQTLNMERLQRTLEKTQGQVVARLEKDPVFKGRPSLREDVSNQVMSRLMAEEAVVSPDGGAARAKALVKEVSKRYAGELGERSPEPPNARKARALKRQGKANRKAPPAGRQSATPADTVERPDNYNPNDKNARRAMHIRALRSLAGRGGV